MLKKFAFAFIAALVLANASIAAELLESSAALAQGFGGGHIGRFQPLVPPPPTPQFNNPGPQITLPRPGNPVNQQGSLPESPLGRSLRCQAGRC